MCRLIKVFDNRPCQNVSFLTLLLKYQAVLLGKLQSCFEHLYDLFLTEVIFLQSVVVDFFLAHLSYMYAQDELL